MTIKDIHKSQAIYNELVKLDGEIIEIEKRAQELSSNNITVDLSLSFPLPNSKKVVDQSTGDLLGTGDSLKFQEFYNSYWFKPRSLSTPDKDVFSLSVSETEALMVLSVILRIKRDKRAYLLAQLEELGFTIN